jgi:hypothetical protein
MSNEGGRQFQFPMTLTRIRREARPEARVDEVQDPQLYEIEQRHG